MRAVNLQWPLSQPVTFKVTSQASPTIPGGTVPSLQVRCDSHRRCARAGTAPHDTAALSQLQLVIRDLFRF